MSRTVPLMQCVYQSQVIDVVRIRDNTGRVWVEHAYPGRDGADLEGMGGNPSTFEVTAVFLGAKWYARLGAFKLAVEQELVTAPGVFIHPAWGKLYGAVKNLSVDLEDRKHDYAEVTFTFVEGNVVPYAFRVTSSLPASAAAASAASSSARTAAAGLGD